MQEYMCPQCAKKYPILKERLYCDKCKQPLVTIGNSTQNSHVIGRVADPTKPVPKCPTCQSINIRKISGLERGASVFALGLFSKKINKSFKCENCGLTW